MSDETKTADEPTGKSVRVPSWVLQGVAAIALTGGGTSLAVSTQSLAGDLKSVTERTGVMQTAMEQMRQNIQEIQLRLPRDGEVDMRIRALIREMVKPEAIR